jgi:hypothetical protein
VEWFWPIFAIVSLIVFAFLGVLIVVWIYNE